MAGSCKNRENKDRLTFTLRRLKNQATRSETEALKSLQVQIYGFLIKIDQTFR